MRDVQWLLFGTDDFAGPNFSEGVHLLLYWGKEAMVRGKFYNNTLQSHLKACRF